MTLANEITPDELAARLASDNKPFLLDVRNPYEVAIASIPGTSLVIPLDQLAERIGELDKATEMVIYCRSGARSGRAVEFLRYHGFTKLTNLAGGILRWSDDVDPSVQKY
jgi:sulfur-carrier protein adenylyltransferase/sulfurtransferase